MNDVETGAKRRCAAVAAAVCLVAAAAEAPAHHAFGAFDLAREQVLRGRIVEFRWTHPHTETVLDAENADGSVTRWVLEGMDPNSLGRRNWTRHTLTAGDEIEAVFYPRKSGEPGGLFVRATLADGSVRVMFARPPR